MSLPRVGAKGADKILEMREAKGDLELEDLSQVPYLRLKNKKNNGFLFCCVCVCAKLFL
jgi:DNA uptake protein ComE-like DNA-binding protein